MNELLDAWTRLFRETLTGRGRALILLAALALIPTFFLPLWKLDFWAQQYPEGLELYIYSHTLEGGNDGNDLTEINILNHYIGMAELREADFHQFKWIPLFVGFIIVLTLRAAAVGTFGAVVDIAMMSFYFALFSLWNFWSMLTYYGENLDPTAAVKVEPFAPPVFGMKMVGQFKVWSFPASGTYFFVAFGILIVTGLALSRPWRFRNRGAPS